MKRWLEFLDHRQPNPYVRRIWFGLFVNLLAVLLPFVVLAPVAATVICALLAVISYTLHLLKWHLPAILAYGLAILFALVLRSVLPQGHFSAEIFTSTFALLALSKSTHLKTYQDAVIFLVLTLTTNASLLLLDRDSSILVALWCTTTLIWTLGNLLRINLKDFSSPAILASLKSALVASIYTLPLLVFLFYIFQKFSKTPMYVERGESLTGLSRIMEPGQVAKLTESSRVAFRVKMKPDDIPLLELYWRGPSLSQAKGLKWTARKDLPELNTFPRVPMRSGDPCLIQQVIYLQRSDFIGLSLALDEPLADRTPLALNYRVNSYVCRQERNLKSITSEQLKPYLDISNSNSPALSGVVHKLVKNGASPDEFAAKIYHFFKQNKFQYMLQPQVAFRGTNLDDFIFNTRSGFCEHYAAAFAVMARIAGIPSRVVTGFQGGTFNRFGGYWVVSYRDAHAWVELYDHTLGWRRYDPTAVVAPLRIQKGAQAYFGEKDFDVISSLLDAGFFWVQDLFKHRETIFSLDDFSLNPFHGAALLFVIMCWFSVKYLNRDYREAANGQFLRLLRTLDEQILSKSRWEGFEAYKERLLRALAQKPTLKPLTGLINRVFSDFVNFKYGPRAGEEAAAKRLYTDIRAARRALLLKENFLTKFFGSFQG